MEHSVCKVSLAHHTKEWLSALFEALDGLELSVNNYLFTLLWIACRNKRLSHHLYRHSPPSSLPITAHYSAYNGGTGKWWYSLWSHQTPFWAHLPLYCQSCGWGRCPVKILPLGFWSCLVFFFPLKFHKRKQAAPLSGESAPCNRTIRTYALL